MSSTEIYKVRKNGDVVLFGQAPNSFRGAMNIWRKLWDTYIAGDFYMALAKNEIDDVWKLANIDTVPILLRVALASTFDNIIVKKTNIPYIIAAFREFSRIYGEGASNLPGQIEILKRLQSDDDCIGVAWNQTSVNSDTWTFVSVDEVERDYDRPYNINKGKRHSFLFNMAEPHEISEIERAMEAI